ncbi:MAG: two-component system cell cycle sensor histidine kinase/response regulator CckA [Desulforhopalus sp.]|jgi:two-component system cell cycle sensor histidine kinase/response regulator CckA
MTVIPPSPVISTRGSIATGLIKKAFLVYILFALTITAIHMFMEYRRVKEDVIVELNTVYLTFRKPLAIAVWDADREQIASLLEGLVASKLIYGVSVTEAKGILVQQVGNVVSPVKGQKFEDGLGVRLESINNQDYLFGYQYPISHSEIGPPKILGHVALFTSKLIILNKIKYQFFYIIVTECIKACILWLVFLWYGKRQLTRPLSGLAVKASEVTMDNLQPIHINVPGKTRNEVTVLQDAFNTMINNLIQGVKKQKDLYSELDLFKNNLQLQVDTRTQELQETNRDLTAQIKERKEAEDKASQYGRILENSLNEIYVFNSKNLEFLTVNKEARKNLGYSFNELKSLTVPDILPEFSTSTFEDKISPLHRREEEMLIIETTHKRKDASTYDVEVHLQLMTFPGMEVFVAIILDISEKRLLEEQLRQSQKMEVIGTLAGGVAHDLNNILSGIVSYPELLLTGIPEDSHLRKPLLTIQNSGQKAARIVQDLLTMARRGVSVTEVVNLNQVISDQLESPEMEELTSFHPCIQVIHKLDDALLNVKGSPTHLSKSIMNLLSNAAEAMSTKGIIKISTANVYLDKAIKGYEEIAEGDYVKLTVSDDGMGIAPKDIEKIFEPFYTKKSMARSGTGLGMAVVWGTVKDHNGYIDIKSTEGAGTTITIYIPITREGLKEKAAATSLDEYRGNGESILIIDDVEEQREVASAMLEKLGYSVFAVSSGENALEYLKTNSPALLILDMIMEPGLDGLDTYKRVLEINPLQKVIIASGYSRTSRVIELQQLGAGRYVKKPYTLMSIGFAVKEELEA